MELSTVGTRFNIGRKEDVFFNRKEDFLPETGLNSRLCLIFVEEGTGILHVDGERIMITAPSLYCLNEKETREVEQAIGLKAQSVYFHPGYINNSFDFENIRAGMTFAGSVKEDHSWLRPFIERNPSYRGQILIGPGIAQRVSLIFKEAADELESQYDEFWPCRCRSYFLELLFMIYRLFLKPQIIEYTSLPGEKRDIDQVMLYLNVNYMNRITVEDLSKTFHINRTTLNEKFVAATGDTIKKYILRLRIRIACMLLRDTLLPVEEVMYRSGYSDLTHFGRSFRKFTGSSPSEYRNNCCWVKATV